MRTLPIACLITLSLGALAGCERRGISGPVETGHDYYISWDGGGGNFRIEEIRSQWIRVRGLRNEPGRRHELDDAPNKWINLANVVQVSAIADEATASKNLAEDQSLREAKAEVMAAMQKTFLKRGDSWFTRSELSNGTSYFHEYRDFSLQISPYPIADADKLNGIEWQGGGSLNAKANRRTDPVANGVSAQKWWDWRATGLVATVAVRKRNGIWEVDKIFSPDWRKPNESDIPTAP